MALTDKFDQPLKLRKSLNGLLKTALSMRPGSDHSDVSKAQFMAIFAFGVRVASAGLLYLAQALLARWLGSFEYGVFVFVWVFVLMLGGLASIGLNTAAIRFLPHYEEKKEPELARGFIQFSQVTSLILATLIAVLGMAGLYVFADLLSEPYVLPAFLILICLPLYTLTDVQEGVARAYSWIGLALLPVYILRPLLLLAAMLWAYMAGFEMSAATAAACAILSTWGAGIIQWLFLRRRLSTKFKANDKTSPLQRNTKYWLTASAPLVLIEGFDQLLQHTDIVVLTHFTTPAEVAVYFAAAKTIAFISFIRFAVSAGFANKFSAYHAKGDRQKLEHFIRDAVKWTFWPSVAAAVLLLILGKPLLYLFGPEFTSGYPIMFILVVGLLIRSATGPAEFILNMLGEQKTCAAILFASVVLNIALNIILIPEFGVFGAAAATAAAHIIDAILFSIAASRRLKLNIFVWGRASHTLAPENSAHPTQKLSERYQ